METIPLSLSVKVIVRDTQGLVLLLQRSATSKGNPGKWEFPGGKVDRGEQFDAALIREVREETGLTVALVASFGTCESRLYNRHIVYLVIEGTTRAKDVRLSSEHMNCMWVSPSDFADIDFAPQFRALAQRYAQDVIANPRTIGPIKTQVKPEDLFKNCVVTPHTLRKHLQRFSAQKRRLKKFSHFLGQFLSLHAKRIVPMAEISARPKEAASFAGKLIKKDKYTDPFKQVTDLVGARVVVHLASEVDAVCRWVESTFEVDRANSGDKLKELGADKFGYRSVHFVVEIMENKPPGVPTDLIGLKAEIQVRTIAQHAWSDIGHDRIYKCDCDVPDFWKREANRISALLEAADEEFARLVRGLAAYQDHVKQSPDEQTAQRQIALWDVVRKELPKHAVPALRTARLALEREDWPKVIDVLKAFKGTPTTELLSALGYALCRKSSQSKTSGWRQGIRVLENAAKISDGNLEPFLRLGELLAPHDRKRALHWFEQAFLRDSSNPAALVGYIRHKVLEQRSLAFIPLLRPEIEQAIKRSEDLAAANADLPHALYRIAGFLMLLGPERGHASLEMFAHAVHKTRGNAAGPLVQALKDISELARLERDRVDVEAARRFLAAAYLTKCPGQPWPSGVTKPAMKSLSIRRPVVIVAGGCDARHDRAVRSYEPLLKKAFSGFSGTIISGGTMEGISGVVGTLAKESNRRITAIGYLPKRLPSDGTATRDDRYKLRRTDRATEFTALEPIQSWLDMIAAKIDPKQVRLLGINGGNIAGLEYRLAIALGACVGVIEGSGREAERVCMDWPAVPEAKCSARLLVLPPDAMTLRAFITAANLESEPLTPGAIESAAKSIHKNFLEEQRYKNPDRVMQPWINLDEDLRESNRNQIAYLVSILRVSGFDVRQIQNSIPNDPRFTEDEIRRMGEMEHGRWNVERLASGWRFAKKKDAQKKLSPYVVSWDRLDPGVQKYDFQNVRWWPQALAEVGYEIYRVSDLARARST